MVLQVLCWFCVVACVSSKVVHQANGIVSIITELEPDRTPVAYLQAVDSPGRTPNLQPPDRPARVSNNLHQGIGRPYNARDNAVNVVAQTEDIPLEEGQFRVKSAEIRLVNPDTREEQQSPAPVEEKKEEQVTSTQGDERTNDPNAESASDNKVVYPLNKSEDDQTNRESRYRGDFPPSRDFERPRKQGKYGSQTPRGGDVRYDPNTRVRDNDDGPTKIYKPVTDRPLRRGDEFVTSKRKSGKAGHYVTDPPLSRPSYRRPSVKERDKDIGLQDFRRDDVRNNNNNRQIKTEKDYSSKTVVKYPNGQAREKERRVESSSKFKIGNSENKKFSNPTDSRNNDRFTERSPFINDKIESEELHGASSFLDSSIETDDGSFEHSYSGRDFYGPNKFGDYGNRGLVGIGDYGGGHGLEKHFERAGGNDYVAAREFARGAKSEKGHNNEDSYLNEQREKHGLGKNKGYAEEKDSDKKSHLDQSSRYTSGQQSSVGSKGEDSHKNKGHRKGHKKSGFHSVVHKDEFNKKEEFYDEEHSSGEDKHHGHKSGQHYDNTGGHVKKEHLDSGHHDSHRGHEGGHDKGQRYQQQQRYQKDRGHSGHFGHDDEHEKRTGHKEGEVHQHTEFGRYR